MSPRFFSIALLAASLAALGCEHTVKPPIEARQDPYQSSQINIAQNDLRLETAVDAPRMSRDDAGLLYVVVPIRAATNLKLHVDYRVTFFDRNGHPLNQTGWLHKELAPNVPDQITFNSSKAQATDFQMDLRYSE